MAKAGVPTASALMADECATIAISPDEHNRAWATRELVLLHELAHHLAPGGGGDHRGRGR